MYTLVPLYVTRNHSRTRRLTFACGRLRLVGHPSQLSGKDMQRLQLITWTFLDYILHAYGELCMASPKCRLSGRCIGPAFFPRAVSFLRSKPEVLQHCQESLKRGLKHGLDPLEDEHPEAPFVKVGHLPVDGGPVIEEEDLPFLLHGGEVVGVLVDVGFLVGGVRCDEP